MVDSESSCSIYDRGVVYVEVGQQEGICNNHSERELLNHHRSLSSWCHVQKLSSYLPGQWSGDEKVDGWIIPNYYGYAAGLVSAGEETGKCGPIKAITSLLSHIVRTAADWGNIVNNLFFYLGGSVDPRAAGSQHRVCGRAISKVPIFAGGATKFPKDWAEPGYSPRSEYQAKGML